MTDRSSFDAGSPRFQVLALDGGGAKALFTAHVLARLEADLDVNICDSFDLIAGTSAGGIIALALGAGIRPAEIADRYTELVTKVFPQARRGLWNASRRLVRPTYESAALRAALVDLFGARKLGDSTKRLVIPAWDAQNGAVHLFKTFHHPELRRDWRIPMVDIALATSAAPTYFSVAKVDGQRFIDGGIWANNPSVVAITEAVRTMNMPLSSVRVLNVGTTDQHLTNTRQMDNGGILTWAPHAISLVLTAGSRGGQGIAQQLVGKNNYSRFDAMVPGGMYSLDKADAEDIAGHAASASRGLSPVYTKRFASHLAPVFTPGDGAE
ncbi:CBASS cGAMP-activated phospholipase [Cryobacterium sp. Y82]|uniref:CBASS cGAMP-activated phospholipase n=1 Tax=Cryobacterium sp. Y82 TaxID=2045017 RepID=UPI000CE32D8B|nr:CBASS cGAMP-activated phospholipase [Cryobacterium sp. Y82]